MNLYEIDSQMLEICQDILKLKYINPMNQDSEKKKFFSSSNYNPKFRYLEKNLKLNRYRKMLEKFYEQVEDSLFKKKIKKLIIWIDILDSVGYSNFTQNSIKYYGKTTPKLVRDAKRLLRLKEEKEDNNLSTEEVTEILNRELKKFPGWSSIVKENLGSRVDNVTMEKILYVKSGEGFSKEDVKRLIIHEIGVHTTRSSNGEKQRYNIFQYGTANYEETEEGLAVYIEEKNNLLRNKNLKNYAGRVLAIDLALKNSFRETFNFLQNYFSDEEAYNLT
ncbi:DUF1704 domain-containing protein [Candidatus Woesearchaeota archaeon]|nr:DUF1704 domain-containing protein [Candidatus Woesearchaeota archaeon]